MKPDNSAPEHTGKAGVDRRTLLTAAGGIAATAAVGGAVWMGTAASQSKASDIVMMNAMDLSSAIKAKKLACAEVMTAYLDHIGRINPKVNAIVSLQDRGNLLAQAKERDAQLARGEYLGWMHGFPQAIKDLEIQVTPRREIDGSGQVTGWTDGPIGWRGFIYSAGSFSFFAAPDATSTVPAGYKGYSPLYEFGPAGLHFDMPVAVTLPFHAGSANPAVYWSKETGDGFDELGDTRVYFRLGLAF